MQRSQLLFSLGFALALGGGCATAIGNQDDDGGTAKATHPDSGTSAGDDDGGGSGDDGGAGLDSGGGGHDGGGGGGGGGTLPDGAPAPACYASAQAPSSCVAPTAKAGSTACSTSKINSFIDACLTTTSTQQGCQAWANGSDGVSSCGTCLKSWSLPDSAGLPVTNDRDACYYAVLPTCRNDVKCYFDCVGAVCQSCSTQDDADNCQAASDNGACGAQVSGADSCLTNNQSAIQVCIPQDIQGGVTFYQDACQQNAAF